MTFEVARRILTIGLGVWFMYTMTRQCRRPSGWFGRRVARVMNIGHAGVAAWGLGHVTIEPHWRILDIGCGGGQNVRTMAEAANAGHVDGVDYAPASLQIARETNAGFIASGRVSVQEASVSQLPFSDRSFDLVTAVETHYYWPDLPKDLREILRVLKPGGHLLIIAETYKGRRLDWLFRPVMRLLFRATYLSPDEHRQALTEAGFKEVAIDAIPQHGWIAALGVRPSV